MLLCIELSTNSSLTCYHVLAFGLAQLVRCDYRAAVVERRPICRQLWRFASWKPTWIYLHMKYSFPIHVFAWSCSKLKIFVHAEYVYTICSFSIVMSVQPVWGGVSLRILLAELFNMLNIVSYRRTLHLMLLMTCGQHSHFWVGVSVAKCKLIEYDCLYKTGFKCKNWKIFLL